MSPAVGAGVSDTEHLRDINEGSRPLAKDTTVALAWAMERFAHFTTVGRTLAACDDRTVTAAELGQPLSALMGEAAALVAQGLDVSLVKIMELLPVGQVLLLSRAGAGSQAGNTLMTSGAVVLEDAETEGCFTLPPLPRDHSVASGLSVTDAGAGRPCGILGALSR